jgi:hypothetical protein
VRQATERNKPVSQPSRRERVVEMQRRRQECRQNRERGRSRIKEQSEYRIGSRSAERNQQRHVGRAACNAPIVRGASSARASGKVSGAPVLQSAPGGRVKRLAQAKLRGATASGAKK